MSYTGAHKEKKHCAKGIWFKDISMWKFMVKVNSCSLHMKISSIATFSSSRLALVCAKSVAVVLHQHVGGKSEKPCGYQTHQNVGQNAGCGPNWRKTFPTMLPRNSMDRELTNQDWLPLLCDRKGNNNKGTRLLLVLQSARPNSLMGDHLQDRSNQDSLITPVML